MRALRLSRSRVALAAVCVLLLAAGVTLLFVGFGSQKHPPRPSAAAAIPLVSSSARTVLPSRAPTSVKPAPKSSPSPLPTGVGSDPIQITIPQIHVQAGVMLLGLNGDDTVQTPPLSRVGEAGWYKFSPTPGHLGPSVILGHVDSAQYGLGVFFNLGRLRPGDAVSVLRADHMTAEFSVDRVVEYPKSAFPTQQVYGNTTDSQLRLITCGGQFDKSARSYLDNIIVFASLRSLRRT